jgi:glycosyltransferase involved in cell wall biosynthesis
MWRLFAAQSERLRLFRLYRSILTHTDHMRREMERHGLGARVVPYPVAIENGRDFTATAEPGCWRLLFAARMEDLKGGNVLIDALPAVSKAAGDRRVRVTLAGDGSLKAAWQARAEVVVRRHGNLQIDFPGWLPQAAVSALMRQADLLVVPSLWPEPFGCVGPAAGHYAVPAAAFASGGIQQWLEDGVTGHVAPADPPTAAGLARAILQCLENPTHHAELRAGARAMSTRFTLDRHLPALLDALAAAAARPGVPAAS